MMSEGFCALVLFIISPRISLTKLHVSSHQLHIETGRYNKPASLPFEKRLCMHCGKVEDEEHFLCECMYLQ